MDVKNSEEVDCLSNTARKRKKSQDAAVAKEVFTDYCSSTSIHGMGYLGAEDKSFPEKIWWVCVIILSIIFCGYLISKVWIKWKTSPVILSFEQEQTAVWEIPFPAVTLCPLSKIPQYYYNFTEMYRRRNNLSETEYKKFWDIALMCNLQQYDVNYNCTLNITDKESIDNMRQVTWDLNQLLFAVVWQGREYRGNEFFSEQLTEDGICFTFNSFSQEDMYTKDIDDDITYIDHTIKNVGWNLEDGYSRNSKLADSHPRRTAKDGSDSGLRIIIMDSKQHRDYVCGQMMSGFKLILHNPAETPRPKDHYYLFPMNRAVAFRVIPQLTTTSQNLRSLSPSERKCYFSNEKSLQFYKVYTQSNCQTECNVNVTKLLCGCVPFYMPHDKNTPICAYGKTSCIAETKNLMLSFAMIEKGVDAPIEMKENEAYKIYDKCNCLPSCSDLQFTTELSQTKIHYLESVIASGHMENEFSENKDSIQLIQTGKIDVLQIDIFYKDMQFLALHRSELYGHTDFLANCGGLLGLFMGFSLLSLIEIFYFLTIRLFIKLRNNRKKTADQI